MPKTITYTFANIPDDWSEQEFRNAVAMGLFIYALKKNPELRRKIKDKAVKF